MNVNHQRGRIAQPERDDNADSEARKSNAAQLIGMLFAQSETESWDAITAALAIWSTPSLPATHPPRIAGRRTESKSTAETFASPAHHQPRLPKYLRG